MSVLKRQALDAIADGTPGQGHLQTANLLQARPTRRSRPTTPTPPSSSGPRPPSTAPGREVFIASGLTLGLLFGILLTHRGLGGDWRCPVAATTGEYHS
ncbi:MAG: hypothetical protein U0R78_00585 [Nocardioidaceae bacterium]